MDYAPQLLITVLCALKRHASHDVAQGDHACNPTANLTASQMHATQHRPSSMLKTQLHMSSCQIVKVYSYCSPKAGTMMQLPKAVLTYHAGNVGMDSQ